MRKPIITTEAQNVEVYGLEVNLLSSENLSAFQLVMSQPNAGIVAMNIREDAEVIL